MGRAMQGSSWQGQLLQVGSRNCRAPAALPPTSATACAKIGLLPRLSDQARAPSARRWYTLFVTKFFHEAAGQQRSPWHTGRLEVLL